MPVITRFIASQMSTLPPLPKADLAGKVFIVTGANSIGLEIAHHLAKCHPAKLILACRNLEAGDQARRQVLQQAPDVDVDVWKVDLASFASVKAFAQKCDSSLVRLDGVGLNAGMMGGPKREVTEDGHEVVTQVNVLAPIYLALLLIPLLRKTAQGDISAKPPLPNPYTPRIIFTGSRVSENAPTKYFDPEHPLEQLDDKKSYKSGQRYDESKLVEHSLVRHLIGVVPDLVITSVCPGFVNTPLYRGGGPVQFVVKRIGRTPEAGARSISHAILLLDKSTDYYADCKPTRLHIDWMHGTNGKKFENNLWKESLMRFEQLSPGIAAAAGVTL